MTIPTPETILALLDDDVNSDSDLWSWLCEVTDDRGGRPGVVPTTAFLLKGLLDGDVTAIDEALAFTGDLDRISMNAHCTLARTGRAHSVSYRVALGVARENLPITDPDVRELFSMASPAPGDSIRYLHAAPVDLSQAILSADRARVASILLPVARDHSTLTTFILTLSRAWEEGMYSALRILSTLPQLGALVLSNDTFNVRDLLAWQHEEDARYEKLHQEAMAHVAAGGSLPYPPIRDDE